MANPNPRASSIDTYFIKPGYTIRDRPEYFKDNLVEASSVVHQPEVYPFAAYLGRRFGCKRIIDIGCGRAHKLVKLHPEFQVIGVDYGSNLDYCRNRFDFGLWIEHDLEHPDQLPLDSHLLRDSVVVCADVIEHLVRPDAMLHCLRDTMMKAAVGILTTPDRSIVRGLGDTGPPGNPHHVREWDLDELVRLFCSHGLNIEFSGYTLNNDSGRLKSTSLLILGQDGNRPVGRAPSGFRVVAFMNGYNEADIIVPAVKHLNRQGVDVYFIDNWSTDGTYELACSMLGEGILRVDRFPEKGPSQHYNWKDQLVNVEHLSRIVEADWFIHHDVDELRESPWTDVTLRDALYHVDQLGFNCVDHTVLMFHPTDNLFEHGSDFGKHIRYFEPGRNPGHFQQIKAWKNLQQPLLLSESGGHRAAFEGSRVYPYKFLLKHYPFRSQAHGEKKVFQDRKPRWNPDERAQGWHIQYDRINEAHSFLRSPSELTLFDRDTFHKDYLVERLSSVGIAAL